MIDLNIEVQKYLKMKVKRCHVYARESNVLKDSTDYGKLSLESWSFTSWNRWNMLYLGMNKSLIIRQLHKGAIAPYMDLQKRLTFPITLYPND